MNTLTGHAVHGSYFKIDKTTRSILQLQMASKPGRGHPWLRPLKAFGFVHLLSVNRAVEES